MRIGPITALTGAWEILLLVVRCRFRINGAYLSWRRETAFGEGHRMPTSQERLGAMLTYGRWVNRMKRLR